MIAVEASELEEFTPAVLTNLAAPPVFKLRPASGREMRKYQFIMQSEGLQYHDKDAFRAEMLRALRNLWSEADYAANEARLQSYWALLDQKGEPDPAEREAVDALVTSLAREWRPLAVMAADNARFGDESLRIVVSMFVVGWSNVDVSYGREAGRVPLDRVDELAEWLGETEAKAIADKVEGVIEPGLAFIQLCNACYERLSLTRQEEKNSSSPPPSPPAPNGSTRKSSRKTGGAGSKASASSKSAQTA